MTRRPKCNATCWRVRCGLDADHRGAHAGLCDGAVFMWPFEPGDGSTAKLAEGHDGNHVSLTESWRQRSARVCGEHGTGGHACELPAGHAGPLRVHKGRHCIPPLKSKLAAAEYGHWKPCKARTCILSRGHTGPHCRIPVKPKFAKTSDQILAELEAYRRKDWQPLG